MLRSALTVLLFLVASSAGAVCYEDEGPPGTRYKTSCASQTDWFKTQQEACTAFDGSTCGAQFVSDANGSYGAAFFYAPSSCKKTYTPTQGAAWDVVATSIISQTGCSTGFSLIDGSCKKVIPCQCVACQPGTFRRTLGEPPNCGECEQKCPENEEIGPHEFDSGSESICAGRQEFIVGMGWSPVEDYQNNPVKCLARQTTGTSVCGSQDGVNFRCYADNFRLAGGECSDDEPIQVDNENLCSAGEVWCKSNGSCPSGFTQGSFNGALLCIKNGETVTNTPQTKSPHSPPYPPDLANPPNSFPPSDDPSLWPEEEDPNVRRVIGVGPGAGIGGGGAEIEIETCGLPGKPKCRIDETGTPSGAGAYDSANAALDAAKVEATNAINTVTSSSGKSTSWGFALLLPTTCSALSVDMIFETVVIDVCAWQGVMHDLMSMVWAATTLFFVVGLVGRTLREA